MIVLRETKSIVVQLFNTNKVHCVAEVMRRQHGLENGSAGNVVLMFTHLIDVLCHRTDCYGGVTVFNCWLETLCICITN